MLTAEQNRAKAAEYTELLKAASLPAEVHEFQRLERSYLMLAENEEWMAGNHDKINIRGADENSYGDSVPASDGSGQPGLSMSGWFGFFAPKGTPKDIIAKAQWRDGGGARRSGRAQAVRRSRTGCRSARA